MQEHAVLGQLSLGYSPLLDRKRAISALRLSAMPLRAGPVPDAGALMTALLHTWPAQGGALQLKLAHEGLLSAALALPWPAHVSLEVPAFMAADARLLPALQQARAGGVSLVCVGAGTAMPAEALACFAHAMLDLSEAAPSVSGPARSAHTLAGVHNQADVEAAFKLGAQAVLGWPFGEAPTVSSGKASAAPALQVIVQLINGVDQEAPMERLESLLGQDPTLAFRLLRYINSPAFGLRVEINSFRHAIMMLGHQKLKRWLALLLATASKDVNQRALMFAAVRRGLFMERLVSEEGDADLRNELFLCGVFSLLDRLMNQSFADLLKTIPVPERVVQGLAGGTGPFKPYLDLVRAVEMESAYDLAEAAEALLLGVSEVNHALLAALAAARDLD